MNEEDIIRLNRQFISNYNALDDLIDDYYDAIVTKKEIEGIDLWEDDEENINNWQACCNTIEAYKDKVADAERFVNSHKDKYMDYCWREIENI